MKAVAASLATALVLVGAAWAGNVTPRQLAKLNARVTVLDRQVASLAKTNACLVQGWNAQSYQAYLVESWDGFATKSGSASLFTAPAPADGLAGTGYVVVSPSPGSTC